MRSWLVVVLLLMLGVCGNSGAAVWYVDVDCASETQDGMTWATAFNTIQAGVDAASTNDEVWVAEGIYTAIGNTVVVMKTGVDIYGGFAGTENLRGERNWTTYQTIIDGEDTRRGVTGADNATLDGFTITRGYAYNGSAMYNFFALPMVTNCVFSNNAVKGDGGGGIYNYHSSPTLTNCVFTNNIVVDEGEGEIVWFPDPALDAAIRVI